MRDQRTTFILAFLMMCVIVLLMTVFASASLNPGTSARAFCLYEPTRDAFISSKNLDLRLPMASTTKIMTGILAVELAKPDELVRIPAEATGIEGSSVYLKPDDRLTIGDLVYSLLLQSANDAACALAYAISGDINEFVNLMNAKAAEIGLQDTHFDNPHGLDSPNHYTSARDLARLTAYALKNKTFSEIVSTYSYSFYIGEKTRNLTNHNKLLRLYDGVIGVKTGYTDKSGRCLVSACVRDGITLIAVTLNDPNDWEDHKGMYEAGFSSLSHAYISDLIAKSIDIPILNAEQESLIASIDHADNDFIVKTNKDDIIDVKILYDRIQSAPFSAGDIIGKAVFSIGGKEVARYNIISTENIPSKKCKFSLFN